MFHEHFLGMHYFGWIFWLAVLIGIFYLLRTAFTSDKNQNKETPVDILKRKYAEGSISIEEYEKRKSILERDA